MVRPGAPHGDGKVRGRSAAGIHAPRTIILSRRDVSGTVSPCNETAGCLTRDSHLYVNVNLVVSFPCPMTQPARPPEAVDPGLLRINEVAAETGLTTRAIRYYEEVGLLEPAARSEGDYRLYDASDLDRLRFIRDLRDDAGFSLAQIRQLLEDDAARERNRTRLRETADPIGTARAADRRPRSCRPADRDPRGEGRSARDDDRGRARTPGAPRRAPRRP